MSQPDAACGSPATRLSAIKARIRELEKRYGREPESVRLLAVSKTKPGSMIREVAAQQQLDFGENYVDEGIEKCIELNDLKLCWHFIGHIQSNKTRRLAEHFDWVQSVERLKIAERLAGHRAAKQTPLNICIQLKLDDEQSKSGCSVAELSPLAEFIDNHPKLVLRGVMAIPAPRTELTEQRQVFAELHHWYQSLRDYYKSVDTLSMGMSGDMEAAIAEGSTMVRIGTAVFGRREARQ